MSNQKFLRLLALIFAFGLLVAACGGDDSGSDDASSDDEQDQSDEPEEEEDEETTTTTEETTTTTEATSDDERDDAVGDFGDDVKDEIGEMPTDTTTYGEYVSVSDDSGFLTVEVPVAWSDVDGSPGLFGPDVTASTDVQAFFQTYDVSGLEFQATDIQTNQAPGAVLDAVSQGQAQQCTPGARQPYADPLYTGISQVFEDCGGGTNDFVWLAFEPEDLSFHGVVGVQITNEADIEALERALNTFVVDV